jgi:hypothetical protein
MKVLKLIHWLKVACGAFSERADWCDSGTRAKSVVFAREKHASYRGPTDECTRPARLHSKLHKRRGY